MSIDSSLVANLIPKSGDAVSDNDGDIEQPEDNSNPGAVLPDRMITQLDVEYARINRDIQLAKIKADNEAKVKLAKIKADNEVKLAKINGDNEAKLAKINRDGNVAIEKEKTRQLEIQNGGE